MAVTSYTLAQFVEDLRVITAETRSPGAIVNRVKPLVRELALSRTWVEERHYRCDPGQGFGAHLLHEEPDHTLAVLAGAWLPGRGAPPHDHGTWAVVAGVDGSEKNVYWKRLDDGSRPGYATLQRVGEEVVERIHSRGHVNKKLVGLLVTATGSLTAGDPILVGEKEIGKVTSSTD